MSVSLPVFLEWAGRASVILAATGLVALTLRRSSASARHLVWVLGLVTALVVPALSAAVPKWELPIVRVAAAAPAIPPQGGSHTPVTVNLPPEGGSYLAHEIHPSDGRDLSIAPAFRRETQ